eukprot:4629974-Prymnesium_polylepis.1
MSACTSRPGYDGRYSDDGCERRVEFDSAQREQVRRVRRVRVQFRDVVGGDVKAAVQRSGCLVGGQHGNVMAMCERDVAAWSPLVSPAAEPTGRQTPTVNLNMPSRRSNGTSS